MSEHIAEAQKERETWLTILADSNSNLRPSSSSGDGKVRANSSSRPENNSDDSLKMLCQKIDKNAQLNPGEDDVQFVIIRVLARHIEHR